MIVTPSNAPGFVAAAIAASSLFVEAGLSMFDPDRPELASGIVLDDGLDAGLIGVEAALTGTKEIHRGLCIVVGQVEEITPFDRVDGAGVFVAKLPVFVRENVNRNRGTSGTGIKCIAAITEVIRAVISSPTTSQVHRRFYTASVRNLGVENGTWTCIANLSIPTVIQ